MFVALERSDHGDAVPGDAGGDNAPWRRKGRIVARIDGS
jgi:hypothetical protein